jgi:hypothetical protein
MTARSIGPPVAECTVAASRLVSPLVPTGDRVVTVADVCKDLNVRFLDAWRKLWRIGCGPGRTANDRDERVPFDCDCDCDCDCDKDHDRRPDNRNQGRGAYWCLRVITEDDKRVVRSCPEQRGR